MKKSILLPFMLLTLSCSNQKGESASIRDVSAFESIAGAGTEEETNGKHALYTLDQAAEEDFNKAAAKSTIGFSMDKGDARKVNGVMHLKINRKWKLVMAFKDTLQNTDDPDYREYRFLGQNKEQNQYLIAGSFYEGNQMYLIDKATGALTATTWTEPVISPDSRYLANVSIPTVMEPSPNSIQVWKVVEQGKSTIIVKHFEMEQQELEPFEMYWESPDAIILKVMPMEKFDALQTTPRQEDFTYLRLTIK